jgi:hypothetical protein
MPCPVSETLSVLGYKTVHTGERRGVTSYSTPLLESLELVTS